MAPRRPTAKQLMQHAVDADDMPLLAQILLAGSLEHLHDLQAHEPVPVGQRVTALRNFVNDAIRPPPPAGEPVRA